MSAKRELYREGTPENIKKGYTELVYGGENIEVDKGVISGQSGGSGGGMFYIHLEYDEQNDSYILTENVAFVRENMQTGNIPAMIDPDEIKHFPQSISFSDEYIYIKYVEISVHSDGIAGHEYVIELGEASEDPVVVYVHNYTAS